MNNDERWRVINAVPVGDLFAAMRALGELAKLGATREQIAEAKEQIIKSWSKRDEEPGGTQG